MINIVFPHDPQQVLIFHLNQQLMIAAREIQKSYQNAKEFMWAVVYIYNFGVVLIILGRFSKHDEADL